MTHHRSTLACVALLLAASSTACTASTASTASTACAAEEEDFKLVCADGFVLDGKISRPDAANASTPERVIILLHGSGPQSMDEDLSAVTRDGKRNLFFVDVAETLTGVGFTVMRYHKRTHRIREMALADPAFTSDERFKAVSENPIKLFIEDAMDCVRLAGEKFPDAEIHLLGHSQGCYVALQVAREMPEVKGVALVAFAIGSTDLLLFEQTVYRPVGLFNDVDTDGNGSLDAEELKTGTPVAASLRAQVIVLDLDGNGEISRAEFQGGNLSNLLLRDIAAAYRLQEATYPTVPAILKDAAFKVAFFQGEWDNQTPSYNAKAVEIVARHVWRKDNFSFTYFPELGHALDVRERYDDLQFDTIALEARAKLAAVLRDFF